MNLLLWVCTKRKGGNPDTYIVSREVSDEGIFCARDLFFVSPLATFFFLFPLYKAQDF